MSGRTGWHRRHRTRRGCTRAREGPGWLGEVDVVGVAAVLDEKVLEDLAELEGLWGGGQVEVVEQLRGVGVHR